ncbi:MAG: hypothetical protein M9893_10415 [Pyrinomonadaceae bacterium]|nr:hypothetical protein [Pyrinomonadaceae bacterium]
MSRRIEALKKKLKRPDLKFDVVAHSMGGLIVRYAAMYGDTELPSPIHRSAPWAGAKLFENIVLLGTPNEGSLDALYGFSGGSRWGPIPINLPWVQGISRFDVFTVPATYELLPAPGTLNVVDQYFDPIAIDLYEPETWSRYGWNPIDDPKFDREFTEEERKNAPAFFRAMLARTKHFYEALSAVGDSSQGVSFDLIGSECKETLDTLLIYRKGDRDQYRTLFKATSFSRTAGEKVPSSELKKVMYAEGDGVVTKRSFETWDINDRRGASILRPASVMLVCEDHSRLATNSEVQDRLLALFGGK